MSKIINYSIRALALLSLIAVFLFTAMMFMWGLAGLVSSGANNVDRLLHLLLILSVCGASVFLVYILAYSIISPEVVKNFIHRFYKKPNLIIEKIIHSAPYVVIIAALYFGLFIVGH
jgi:hypothetical protein